MFKTGQFFKILIFLLAFAVFWSCSKDEDVAEPESTTAPEGTGGDDDRFLSSDSTTEGMPSTGGSSFGGDSNGSGGGTDEPSDFEPGTITAGEWNDLDDWEYWLQIMRNPDWKEMQDLWSFYTEERYGVIVRNQQNELVNNALVKLKDAQGVVLWEAKTDNSGSAELWANLYSGNAEAASIEVKYGSGSTNFENIQPISEGKMDLTINASVNTPQRLEIALVVDATGSMGDEMEFLKVELQDVLTKVKNNNANIDLNIGATFYRDEGDDYVTQHFPIGADIGGLINKIGEQSANGGGDFPEAVHSGLNDAIFDNQWSDFASTRLLFLLLDAPPHQLPNVIGDLQEQVKGAAQKGIKIIPITASGIGKETEFLMRFFAIATNGTYVFITNHSGVGGDHIEPTIGQYEVEKLNDLLVRLIGEYSE